jgi:hypothetical protein
MFVPVQLHGSGVLGGGARIGECRRRNWTGPSFQIQPKNRIRRDPNFPRRPNSCWLGWVPFQEA